MKNKILIEIMLMCPCVCLCSTSKMDKVKERWLAAGGESGVISDSDWNKLFDRLLD